MEIDRFWENFSLIDDRLKLSIEGRNLGGVRLLFLRNSFFPPLCEEFWCTCSVNLGGVRLMATLHHSKGFRATQFLCPKVHSHSCALWKNHYENVDCVLSFSLQLTFSIPQTVKCLCGLENYNLVISTEQRTISRTSKLLWLCKLQFWNINRIK